MLLAKIQSYRLYRFYMKFSCFLDIFLTVFYIYIYDSIIHAGKYVAFIYTVYL